MSIFNDLSQTEFINEYWQRKPAIFLKSFEYLKNIVDGNELAGLACAEGVETRIIQGHGINNNWTCQHGPFQANVFETLQERDWTLLVQGVDQWDDEIKNILSHFNFLPTWRLEDIMASYAPIGGSVGPHFDQYDVFLIQVSGSREWQIGQHCDDTSPLQNNSDIKLLSEFDCQQTHTLNAGDMIYIPGGLAHWGTSLSDDCITFSIGFRAPSEKEIIVEALEGLIEHFENADENSVRYRDTPQSIDLHPNKINQTAQQQLHSSIDILTTDIVKQSINQAFGKLVTDPRYSPFNDEEEKEWTETELLNQFNHQSTLSIKHSENSRFAFSDTQLFVNGEAFTCSENFSKTLCDKQISKPDCKQHIDILLNLLNQQFIAF